MIDDILKPKDPSEYKKEFNKIAFNFRKKTEDFLYDAFEISFLGDVKYNEKDVVITFKGLWDAPPFDDNSYNWKEYNVNAPFVARFVCDINYSKNQMRVRVRITNKDIDKWHFNFTNKLNFSSFSWDDIIDDLFNLFDKAHLNFKRNLGVDDSAWSHLTDNYFYMS